MLAAARAWRPSVPTRSCGLAISPSPKETAETLSETSVGPDRRRNNAAERPGHRSAAQQCCRATRTQIGPSCTCPACYLRRPATGPPVSCVCFDQKDAAWPARLRATAAAQIETGPRSRAKIAEQGRDLPATASTASDPLQLLWLSLQGEYGAQAMAVSECQSSLTDEGSTEVTLPPRPRELDTC